MCAISYAPLQSIGAVSCAFCRASVLRPLARFRSPRFPRIFRLRRDGVTTAGHRDHRDRRDRDARGAGLRVSHRHAAGHAGFFVANAVLSRDPLSQGPIGGGSKLPRPRGTRPTPKNTKKAPPRTLPRVPGAQTDPPGRQTHVPRGAKCRCSAKQRHEISTGLTALRTAQRP